MTSLLRRKGAITSFIPEMPSVPEHIRCERALANKVGYITVMLLDYCDLE